MIFLTNINEKELEMNVANETDMGGTDKPRKKKREATFEEKLQKFMYESKQIQFKLKQRTEVKLAGGKKKYAKKHKRK